MDATCGFCTETITITPAGDDDWKWIGADGSTIGTNYPEGYDSPTFWQDLAERDIEAYSMLNAMDQLCMTGWTHSHYPSPGSQAPYEGKVEECCQLPMQLVPRGWICRADCGAVLHLEVEYASKAAA